VAAHGGSRRYIYVIDIIGQPRLGLEDDGGDSHGAGLAESDAELYERLAPELIRFATTVVGPSDAEDLLGSAVVKAISSPRWPAIENKRAYLYRALTNEARSTHRSRSRRRERELRTYRRDDFEHQLVDPALMRALRTLTVRQRAVIYLTYWDDLSTEQIALTLDTSLRTVERDLTNARNRLEETLS
jgi:RNA polymerase sigma-70 factor (ECF subfamily)